MTLLVHGVDQSYQMASTRPAAKKLFDNFSTHLRSKETSFELKIKKSNPEIDVPILIKLIFRSSVLAMTLSFNCQDTQ